MSLYTIGDPHLSFDCDKPMDVFPGWTDYVTRLRENWNKTVSPEDTVVLAGDISWGMSLPQAEADFRFLHELNGEKIILKGNHDYWFSTKTSVERFWEEKGFSSLKLLFNNAYSRCGVAICGTRGWVNDQMSGAADKKVIEREAGRLRASLEAAAGFPGERIAFLHYPPVYYVNESRGILSVLHEFEIGRVYYGHIHGGSVRYAVDGLFEGIDFRLISCDYVDFCPVLVEADFPA